MNIFRYLRCFHYLLLAAPLVISGCSGCGETEPSAPENLPHTAVQAPPSQPDSAAAVPDPYAAKHLHELCSALPQMHWPSEGFEQQRRQLCIGPKASAFALNELLLKAAKVNDPIAVLSDETVERPGGIVSKYMTLSARSSEPAVTMFDRLDEAMARPAGWRRLVPSFEQVDILSTHDDAGRKFYAGGVVARILSGFRMENQTRYVADVEVRIDRWEVVPKQLYLLSSHLVKSHRGASAQKIWFVFVQGANSTYLLQLGRIDLQHQGEPEKAAAALSQTLQLFGENLRQLAF